jgi:hypothetical protein
MAVKPAGAAIDPGCNRLQYIYDERSPDAGLLSDVLGFRHDGDLNMEPVGSCTAYGLAAVTSLEFPASRFSYPILLP